MANGGKDNGRFRTATLVNWHLLPEVELTDLRSRQQLQLDMSEAPAAQEGEAAE